MDILYFWRASKFRKSAKKRLEFCWPKFCIGYWYPRRNKETHMIRSMNEHLRAFFIACLILTGCGARVDSLDENSAPTVEYFDESEGDARGIVPGSNAPGISTTPSGVIISFVGVVLPGGVSGGVSVVLDFSSDGSFTVLRYQRTGHRRDTIVTYSRHFDRATQVVVNLTHSPDAIFVLCPANATNLPLLRIYGGHGKDYFELGNYSGIAEVYGGPAQDTIGPISATVTYTEEGPIHGFPANIPRPSPSPYPANGLIIGTPVPVGSAIRGTIFLSSERVSGAMGGTTGADAICQRLARGANLSGAFSAVIVRSGGICQNTNAIAESLRVPVYSTDGQLVGDFSTFIGQACDGIPSTTLGLSNVTTPLRHPIERTESGALASRLGTQNVWTGSGDKYSIRPGLPPQLTERGLTCGGWNNSAERGYAGNSSSLGSWFRDSSDPCTGEKHLYCLGW